ncbi:MULTISPECIES: S24 family peptidase [unclassified Saccharibacter]|uniref:S24 family peptidase n=1 Tax=unclassified Saccharibacter TaxID=2648722 RepID=UPI001323A7A5|nr:MULTISPECIES: S24 family peptidase [unclassified Saccharibacter]MXV35802.1 helix-turn-helix domain-containing protein [Saccharibacter sp. EH611]MXV57923.1 helix-turn-helix domain-containing protein [Saccharibacter sp. EH70]MXV66318.1 helix-turn-helix domain-containing protein [Saccharibacter sp. EH60]
MRKKAVSQSVQSSKKDIEVSSPAGRLRRSVQRSGGNQFVSDKTGIPLSTLNSYISGRSSMKAEAAAALADACGVSLEWLVRGETTDISHREELEIERSDEDGSTEDAENIDTNSAYGKYTSEKKKTDEERCERLRKAIRLGGGNTAVSMAIRVSKTTLSTYANGRDMKAGTAVAIAEACGVSLEWLLAGRGEMMQTTAQPASPTGENELEAISVPFLRSEASAGKGLVPVEWGNEKNVRIPVDFLRNLLGTIPKDIFFMRVRGDSMQPTINTGDTVIVHHVPGGTLRDGVYAISVNGMAMVKRLGLKNPSTYSVISDNPFYERFDVPAERVCWGTAMPDAEVRVIGRVIGQFHLDPDALMPE